MAQVVQNPPANAGDAGDVGLIPGLRISDGKGNTTLSSILAGKIPWTEEPGELHGVAKNQTRLND